jgi:hypothetical protein
MSHYPFLSTKDKQLVKRAISQLKSLAGKSSNPKLSATASAWSGVLYKWSKTPWPGAKQ